MEHTFAPFRAIVPIVERYALLLGAPGVRPNLLLLVDILGVLPVLREAQFGQILAREKVCPVLG